MVVLLAIPYEYINFSSIGSRKMLRVSDRVKADESLQVRLCSRGADPSDTLTTIVHSAQ